MYSIIQSSSNPRPNCFAIINGHVSPAGYPVGKWSYLEHKGKLVLDAINISDAREICQKLNDGASVADFFHPSQGGYGSLAHQALGDSYLYSDLPGAW